MLSSLLCLGLIGLAAAAKAGSGVVVLTEDNFDSVVAGSDGRMLIEFYAPWCGHCKHFEPTYEKIARELSGHTVVAKVDSTREVSLAQRFGVSGYPTIYHYDGENAREYQGGRAQSAVVRFAKKGWKKVEPSSSGPNSPLALGKGLIGSVIGIGMKLVKPMASTLGIPEMGAQFILVFGGLLAVATSILVLAVITGSRAPRRRHRHKNHTD